ncbi:MAG: ECF-type sigma factor, partial [Planctomycetota bacterium]
RVMRTLLVDHARAKKSAKRGGGQERIALDGTMADRIEDRPATSGQVTALDVLALDEALGQLERGRPTGCA